MFEVRKNRKKENQEGKTMSGKFYVFKCTKCGRWGVKEIRIDLLKARYNCKYCRKTSKIKLNGVYGLALYNHGPYSNPNDATKACQELNKRMRQ